MAEFIKEINYKILSGDCWYTTKGLNGQTITILEIKMENEIISIPFIKKDNEIIFEYNSEVEKTITLVLKSEIDFGNKNIEISEITNLSHVIAQKTPQNTNDLTPYLGLVRFASDKELEVATVGNENGAAVTPKQVLDLVKNAKFRRSLSNDDFPLPGDIQYKTFCNNEKLWCIYTINEGKGEWKALSGGDPGPQGDSGLTPIVSFKKNDGCLYINYKTNINLSSKDFYSVYQPFIAYNKDEYFFHENKIYKVDSFISSEENTSFSTIVNKVSEQV